MDRNNRLRLFRNGAFDLNSIDVQGSALDIHENRPRSLMYDNVGSGGEGNRGCDHLIACSDPCGGKGEMQPRRARVEADRVPAADPFGKLLLELLCPLY